MVPLHQTIAFVYPILLSVQAIGKGATAVVVVSDHQHWQIGRQTSAQRDGVGSPNLVDGSLQAQGYRAAVRAICMQVVIGVGRGDRRSRRASSCASWNQRQVRIVGELLVTLRNGI